MFTIYHQRLIDGMKPSQSLSKDGVQDWLDGIAGAENDLNALMSLIAPDLYDTGKASISMIQEEHENHPNLSKWSSIFTGISVIVNRKTPPHRDAGGCIEWYDLLVAAGTYRKAYLKLHDLRGRLLYNPGTVVAVCGKLFRHSVEDWSGGERICYAHYMRNNVIYRQGLQKPVWVQEGHYVEAMSRAYVHRQQQA
jgi:hypothetical protein